MAIEVESKRIDPVKPTQGPEQAGLNNIDSAAVKNAADRVDATRVAAKIDKGGDDRYDRVDGPKTSGLPIGVLAGRGSPIDSTGVVNKMGELGALGSGDAKKFEASKYSGMLSKDPSKPFTGSGATGVLPTDGKLPAGDLAAMARYDQGEKDLKSLVKMRDDLESELSRSRSDLSKPMQKRREEMLEHALKTNDGHINLTRNVMNELRPTVDSYRNPLSHDTATGDPKDEWGVAMRQKQARLLLEQPISTIHGDAYGDKLPTRGEVIDAAAKKNNLDPTVLAGVILHEQRDQSAKEDVADVGGASLAGRDTSIGLGQVLMSTAMKNNADVLADTVDPARRESLSRGEVARLLSSDEHNIFATARYLRSVADKGVVAGAKPGSLPSTRREFPGFDPSGYSGRKWSDANIGAIASEYTSKPWDDRVLEAGGYPQFVNEAVRDVRRTGMFR